MIDIFGTIIMISQKRKLGYQQETQVRQAKANQICHP